MMYSLVLTLAMLFPLSGVETHPLIPPLVAFLITSFTSMAGLSGAFLIAPFQLSILGFTSPAATPTSHLFNIVATPSGIYRYLREGRLLWPLTAIIILGTLPGVIVGSWIRLYYLPEPKPYKMFVGCVLLYLSIRLSREAMASKTCPKSKSVRKQAVMRMRSLTWRRVEYEYDEKPLGFSVIPVFFLSCIVGIIGGIYGIGGGAIISPFLISFFALPVHTIAGATLLASFVTSVVGVAFFALVDLLAVQPHLTVSPDWLLGGLFGLGGSMGMYVGARTQRFVPARIIQVVLAFVITVPAISYIVEYFR